MSRPGLLSALLLSVFFVTPVMAQDQGLDPILLASKEDTAAASNVEAHGVQLYRLPFSFHLRSLDDTRTWGLRVTFPVSFSSLRFEGVSVSNLGEFAKKIGFAAVIPGLELEVPVGSRTLVRPFGEVGIGKSSDSSAETFYGAGVRVRSFHDEPRLHLTYGGAVSGRKTPALAGTSDRYASYEAGVDAQVPLGFSIGEKKARAGVYVIGRAFDGLELQREAQPPIVMSRQLEGGVSFSTAPDLRIWKIPLRWLAVGYHSGPVSGVRIYATFPF